MKIHWCYKGIAEQAGFSDADAETIVTRSGIRSNWLRANPGLAADAANIDAQDRLSDAALDDHVNAYGAVAHDTPYISLSAGCHEYRNPYQAPNPITALRTAVGFATNRGSTSGYIFRCWAVTAPQPAPEVLGVADEIRDINLFADFYQYHHEGEITAKIVVPRRHIQLVTKIDRFGVPIAAAWSNGSAATLRNAHFVEPSTVANLLETI
jgi:hypothetical protein